MDTSKENVERLLSHYAKSGEGALLELARALLTERDEVRLLLAASRGMYDASELANDQLEAERDALKALVVELMEELGWPNPIPSLKSLRLKPLLERARTLSTNQ